TGAPAYEGDVAVHGGTVAAVGDLTGVRAALELDVSGLYITPGFINLHSHATPSGLRQASNMIVQGVTTEILNADGGGPLDIDEQLEELANAGLAVNVGVNIGFNRVWSEVVGPADRRPTEKDLDRMRLLIVAGLEEGAFGVSAGLDYKPAYFATTDEVAAVVSAAELFRTNFTNHDRLTPETQFSSRVGVTETLTLGARTGLVPIVTHMKAQGHEQGTAQELIDLIDAATASGKLAAADVYPYLAGQSGLGALIIPGWAQDGGREKMLERFRDPVLREKIVIESEDAMNARFGGPEGVYVPDLDTELVDLMKEMGDVSAGEAVVRALEVSNRRAILRFGAESDLVAIMKGATTSIACDCGAVDAPATHPRYFGSFPKVLGRYVRERKHLTWEDAIRKMTGLPAATIGLVDRGLLAPGMAADIVVFDPVTIIDHATFENPNAPPEGVRHVLVNGRLALSDGELTGSASGRALRRSIHMPSRAMTSVSSRLTLDTGAFDIDVRSNERGVARGHLTFPHPRTGERVEVDANLGFLQIADGWASFTATAMANGSAEPVVIIVDERNPLGGGGRSINVRVGPDEAKGRTLLGMPLREPNWSPATRARLEEDLAIARAQFEVAPRREDSIIWLGRRLGYLTRWEEAIGVFTRGLQVHPQSYKLYRFRGRHRARYRDLDGAVEDYRRAAELVESELDSFEPDGILNPRHQYLGTYKSNIHYYLGQTGYALGDYETTLRGMERAASEPLGQSADRMVSTAYWRYLAHRKLGQDEEARAVVAEIPEGLELIENFTYYDAVLFFKGVRTEEELLPGADSIVRFAIAMEHDFRGEQDEAETLWQAIVNDEPQGFWPAEAEILFARSGSTRHGGER
ncbi:MAG TPA: amidohydrolase family protein, partial [Vicinamibacteria bacterium]|nr:amidohydrolase family protein [Vicinamibacteria bacterium]